jgi:NAD-dependent deacetylase
MREKSDMQTIAGRVARFLSEAERVTFLTGAGVSKESGIPTFRDAQTGMWANYNPQELATPEGFRNDPKLVWQWYDYRRKLLGDAEPNPGHRAIVELESLVPKVTVVTQNIDGLHQKAGSSDVVELHGSIKKFYCFDGGHDAHDVPFDLEEPPLCKCGSMIRPGVVWFGEALPPHAMSRGLKECAESEVVFVAGTSALVQPAASLPYAAHRRGAKLIEVNPDETPITDIVDEFMQGPSGQVLPMVVAALKELKGV